MNRESDEEQIEDALRARASLAGDATAGGDGTIGPDFGTNYRLGGIQDYGEEDFDSDDDALDEGIEADDDEAEASPPS